MRSRSRAWFWLVAKELRELLASRAWWLLFFVTGPLAGVAFVGAVRTYAEASGLGGTSTGVGEAFSPLDGIWIPTFAAYEVAATFLLPFVAIRQVAGDRQSGALKLEVQQSRLSPVARVAAKVLVLGGAWCACSIPGLIAFALWILYGGHSYLPELVSLATGHLLNAGLTIAVASAAAAVADNASTAAILALTFTVGTWVTGFIAVVRGGIWSLIAAYTPSAMLDVFQHGLVRASALLAALILMAAGFTFAGSWLRPGVAVRRRAWQSACILGAAALLIAAASTVRASWDLSENRRHSFSPADERALRHITAPLTIEAHLAPEDPRRFDLERQALTKLRRVMPDLTVRWVSATSIGLFEQAGSGYGEIRYDLGGRTTTSRLTTEEAVLETIYSLAGVAPPRDDRPPYPGYPLRAKPEGAAWLFYVAWPALAGGAALVFLRRQR